MKMFKIIIDEETLDLLDYFRLPNESYNDAVKKLLRVHAVKKEDRRATGLEGL